MLSLVERARAAIRAAGNEAGKGAPPVAPDDAWVCAALLDLLSQYPGGLTQHVMLTALVARHMSARAPAHAPGGRATLAAHTKGLAVPPGSFVRAVVAGAEALGGTEGGGGGTWVLHLTDGSTHDPVQMYAHSSLGGLLAQRQQGKQQQQQQQQEEQHAGQHPLAGSRLVLGGPLRPPPCVSASSRRRAGGSAAPAASRLLPCRATALELPPDDPAWRAADVRTHALLGGPASRGYAQVHELGAAGEVHGAIATQQRACVDGWVAGAVVGVESSHGQQHPVGEDGAAHAWAVVTLAARGDAAGPPPSEAGAEAGSQAAPGDAQRVPLRLWGECAWLAGTLVPGRQVLLHSPVVARGPSGASHLELGPETLLVVQAPAADASAGSDVGVGVAGKDGAPALLPGACGVDRMDVDAAPDVDQGATAAGRAQPTSTLLEVHSAAAVAASQAALVMPLRRLADGMTGVAVHAVLGGIESCRRAGGTAGGCLVRVLLEEPGSGGGFEGGGNGGEGSSSGSGAPPRPHALTALLELSPGTRCMHALLPGHTLLLLGCRVAGADSPAAAHLPAWARAAAAGEALASGLARPPLLLWREADTGARLASLSTLPGVLNSPALHATVSLAQVLSAAATPVAGGGEVGSSSSRGNAASQGAHDVAPDTGTDPEQLDCVRCCVVDVVDAHVDTRRVHRACGRPVTACCLDDMWMDEDEEEQGAGAGAPAAVATAPATAVASCAVAAPAAAASPSQDMFLDGLWECAFCGVECGAADVKWGMHGSLTVRHAPVAPAAATAVHGSQPSTWEVGADAPALRALIGVTAEHFRTVGAAGRDEWRRAPRHRAYRACVYHAPPADVGGVVAGGEGAGEQLRGVRVAMVVPVL
ncbi:hypothetical protein FOA52_006668 [Chlamydomonas sp. UWO 241]|nr:hypothetical protein FOA52_006668 [Chlamydomonas sp. UWO 241]